MLYRPESFEPLTTTAWDDRRARDAIRTIVSDADVAFDSDGLWPAHEWDGWQAALPLKNLYVGAAGLVWALDALQRRGLAESAIDLRAAAARTLEAWRAEPDFIAGEQLPAPPEAALLSGESGILLVAYALSRIPEHADDLLVRVRANVGNEAEELMWGVPGTLLAARAMAALTGDARWRAAGDESAEALWSRRAADGLWTQRLYGRTFRSLTPPHGLVGNVQALRPLLDDARRETLVRDARAVLARTAVVEGGLANWPSSDRPELVSADGEVRLQWCCGAPGIVAAAADYLDEELLLAGAELVWTAGPHGLEKGAGICHGTAGNGYALLKAFVRTGDERWLARARAFAMHALEQVDRLRERNGRGRFSLWTGDVGVALYAADCLDERASYPIVDGI